MAARAGSARGSRWAVPALAVLSLLACARDQGPPPAAGEGRPAPARRARAATGDRDRGWIGVVVPAQAVDIAPTTAGQLREVPVRPGDRVTAGMALARLDDRAVREELVMATAELGSASAEARAAAVDLEEAERRVTIETSLVAQGNSAQQRLDEARFQRQRALANRNRSRAREVEARARVQQARRRLDEAVLRAPFAGTVATRYQDPGATVSAGSPIVRLIGGGGLWVRFALPPAQRQQLAVGARVRVAVEAAGTIAAVVRHIAPELDPASNLIFAEAELEIPASLASSVSPRAEARVFPVDR